MSLLPAEARFLQSDPVGYKDDLNLYTYTRNDPINRLDPTGMFANVQVWDNGTVIINVPIEFDNQSVDAGAANAAAANIQARWTGQFGSYNVKTTVTAVSSAQNAKCGCANKVTISDAPTNPTKMPNGTIAENGGHSYVVGDYEGHWTTMDAKGVPMPLAGTKDRGVASKGPDTFAHEGGHLMNVGDESGDNGGIMDQGPGTRPTEGNIRSIMNSPGNSVQFCSKATGACK
ncbi:MAG TPA: RHS repeat-associated core domain-containing protein [Rhizomicrobium sp.]